MFERVLFKSEPDEGAVLDIGSLAEALLFYRHVEIIFSRGSLQHAANKIPANILLRLLQSGKVTAYFQRDQLGVSSRQRWDGRSVHALVRFSSAEASPEEDARGALLKATNDRAAARAIAKQLQVLSMDEWQVQDSLFGTDISTRLAIAALKNLVPSEELSHNARFAVRKEGDGLFIDTNLDFERLSASYRRGVPSSETVINSAWLTALLQGAYETLYIAAKFRTEIANGPLMRAIMKESFELAFERSGAARFSQIEMFSETVLEGHSLREAVNSGRVPFVQVLDLVERSQKFRGWLDDKPIDADLMREFYRDATRGTWTDKLSSKAIRWLIFTGVGAAVDSQLGTGMSAKIAAQGLSVLDAFFVDRLMQGWTPHQFIMEKLKPLVDKK